MTWMIVLSIVIASAVKIILTCPPTSLVEWFLSKFEIHLKLNDNNDTITMNGIILEEQKKKQFIQSFNEAVFLERYYIFPGNENAFLQPKNNSLPFVIDTKRGKKSIKLFVYRYHDHVDVVKLCKKKIIAYGLQSEYLQNLE